MRPLPFSSISQVTMPLIALFAFAGGWFRGPRRKFGTGPARTTGEDRIALKAISLEATCVYSSVLAIDGYLGGAGLALPEGVAPGAPTRELSRKRLQGKASKG